MFQQLQGTKSHSVRNLPVGSSSGLLSLLKKNSKVRKKLMSSACTPNIHPVNNTSVKVGFMYLVLLSPFVLPHFSPKSLANKVKQHPTNQGPFLFFPKVRVTLMVLANHRSEREHTFPDNCFRFSDLTCPSSSWTSSQETETSPLVAAVAGFYLLGS